MIDSTPVPAIPWLAPSTAAPATAPAATTGAAPPAAASPTPAATAPFTASPPIPRRYLFPSSPWAWSTVRDLFITSYISLPCSSSSIFVIASPNSSRSISSKWISDAVGFSRSDSDSSAPSDDSVLSVDSESSAVDVSDSLSGDAYSCRSLSASSRRSLSKADIGVCSKSGAVSLTVCESRSSPPPPPAADAAAGAGPPPNRLFTPV
ncbi:hypothetical protein Hrd1104_11410 [Halorhabdus sp. CBA1104]|nr:hypothetical protein Hrd1104_11410 [Halorhabdus sp. CBA1104]